MEEEDEEDDEDEEEEPPLYLPRCFIILFISVISRPTGKGRGGEGWRVRLEGVEGEGEKP